MQANDMQLMNRQIFSDSNILVSPQHLQSLNNKTPCLFKPKIFLIAPNSGYKVFLSGYAEYVLNSEKKTHIYFQLEKILNQLRSNPRPVDGSYLKKNSVDTRFIAAGSYNVWYKIVSGQVLVFNIELRDVEQEFRDKLEKPGLYKIRKTSQGNWIKDRKVEGVNTSYAAVNGMLNNLNKATWLMGVHLDFEFGKSTMKEYTLFHNPSQNFKGDLWESVRDKLGVTTDMTRYFSKVLHYSQKTGTEIKWVAHSQGGAIFAEGVRYFLNGSSSWAIAGGFNGLFKDKDKISLNNHKVAFHGNANNNARSKLLLDRAGIEVLATRANDYDIVNALAGFNTLNPRKIIGSLLYTIPHIYAGSVVQSPHTLMQSQKDWEYNMEHGPGKGRNVVQKSFESAVSATDSTIRYVKNFLK